MAHFPCLECNICFAAPHQRNGHPRLVHQSTCKIRTATGRITVNWSINDKYPCPVDSYMSTFERSDTLQCHFKGRHAEQNNSALNQHLDDDAQIRAMSLGMLIEPPIEQTFRMAFVFCCAGFATYVWSPRLTVCITTYWGTTIGELPNDIATVALVAWLGSHLLRISHRRSMWSSSPSCKTLA
jgi:hypothetical protein